MKFDADSVRVFPQKKINLAKWPTKVKDLYESKEHCKELLAETVGKISDYQERHYSSRANAVLLIFQGMDGAGKDSAIKHVMSGINPQGCQVFAFKEPSSRERAHDFLWRTNLCLPERGHIGIFNRSYYEEVLVVRVHPEFLNSEAVAKPVLKKNRIWKERFESITEMEKHLYREGTHILKFFFHLSRDEQKQRFLDRIDEPDKNWKIVPSDINERKHWDKYMEAYSECIAATSTKHAPWFVIPADDKENSRLMISQILLDKFKELKVQHPTVSPKRRAELKEIRKKLLRD